MPKQYCKQDHQHASDINIDLEDFVDLQNPPEKQESQEATGLTLYGFSQLYDPSMEVELANDTINAQQKDPSSTEVAISSVAPPPTDPTRNTMMEANSNCVAVNKNKQSETIDSIMAALATTGATFMNCTFNINN